MALWENPQDNSIHDDADGAALSLPSWPQGMVQITQAEADAILNPPLTLQQKKDAVQAQINSLEQAQLLPRITREGLLAAAVALAATQGVTEPQLYAANIGYEKLKDFDASIVALRTQMDALT